MRVDAIDVTGPRDTRQEPRSEWPESGLRSRRGDAHAPRRFELRPGSAKAEVPGTSGAPGLSPDATLHITLGRDEQAPSRARRAVAGLSAESDMSESSLATVKLLVSELVSNAVLHSDAPEASGIELEAQLVGADGVRVEVTDAGSGFTAGRERDPEREGGYGLFLVGSQATSWGIDRGRRRGTCVWFELAEAHASGRTA